MESLDPKNFLLSIHPFDGLDGPSLDEVVSSLDVHYYQSGDIVITKESTPSFYFIIAKGAIEQSDGVGEKIIYGPKDSFDAAALLRPPTRFEYRAAEETILFALPAKRFVGLIKNHPAFESYYLEDISKRIDALQNQSANQEISSFMLTRIKESYFRPLAIVSPECSIYEAVSRMSDSSATAVLVDFGGEFGVVSDSDLRKRVILQRRDIDTPIGEIATRPILTIDQEDFLWSALLTMTERNIKRLVVTDNHRPAGMIEQMDLISAMSHRSHLMQIQIQRAGSVKEVQAASSHIEHLIRSLQSQGVKVRHVTNLLSRLNTKIYQRLWQLIAPEELRQNSALLILGSGGRREQTLRIDQDNALIVADGYASDDLAATMEAFYAALCACGFAPCADGLTVQNPLWHAPLGEYQKRITAESEEALRTVSVLIDGRLADGQASLFDTLKESLYQNAGTSAKLAKTALIHQTPISLFSGFVTGKKAHAGEIEIKEGAIFGIIQGVKALAHEARIVETNTFDRITALQSSGTLDRQMAGDLIEALDFLLTLRLKTQLYKLSKKSPIDHYIDLDRLSKIERDILRDALKIIDRFKKHLATHFGLRSTL